MSKDLGSNDNDMSRPDLFRLDIKTPGSIGGYILLFGLVACLLLLYGCNGFFKKVDNTIRVPISGVNRIAVLPMDRASIPPDQGRITCTLSDTVFDVHEIPPKASDSVTRILFRQFQGDQRFKIVHEGRCSAFLNSMLAADVKASQLRLIQSFGKELKVDAVLYGKLFRYEERIGGDYAIKRPASVAFSLHLIRTADRTILWSTTFDETQQPLTQDIMKARLYRKSGIRWLTAQDLAEYGIIQSVEYLHGLLR